MADVVPFRRFYRDHIHEGPARPRVEELTPPPPVSFVRPMKGSAIARAFGEPEETVDLYASFERHISEAERNHEARARRIADRQAAETAQRDPDEQTREAFHSEVSDALFWLMLGAFGGGVAVLTSLYVMAQMVRP